MTRRASGRIIATLVSLLVVASYVFLTLLFVTPSNPMKSAFAGVTSAASPYFAQKWNVFAPHIAKSNPQLRIQAQWRDDEGQLVKSGWVNVTAVEFSAVAGNALPSRIQKLSWNVLASYVTCFGDLTTEQKAVVQDTFIERFGSGYRGVPAEELIDRLVALGEDRGDVLELLRYDFMIKEYATYFATATFDEEIERVRWEVYGSVRTISTGDSMTSCSTNRHSRASGGGTLMIAFARTHWLPSKTSSHDTATIRELSITGTPRDATHPGWASGRMGDWHREGHL